MNQATLTHMVSQLRIKYNLKHRGFGGVEGGHVARLKSMRRVVTALVKNERIELVYHKADEARGFAERLIGEAIRHGEHHRPTMDMADFWLTDKSLVPKLFKVLVPRFTNDWPIGLPYTRLLRAPRIIYDYSIEHDKGAASKPSAVLELRGNPYPPLQGPVNKTNPGMIHNILLDAAKQEYYATQALLHKRIAKESVADESSSTTEETSLADNINSSETDHSKVDEPTVTAPPQSPEDPQKSEKSP